MKTLSLTKAIDFYLSTRRSLGFALKSNEKILRSLARYAKKVHHRGTLTEKLALDWVRLPQCTNPCWWARRLGVVHRFARFWHQFDNRVQVPPSGVFGPEGRRGSVHLYTQTEIGSLLKAASALPPKESLRPATFYTLFGLLACTGLRISEALHLQTGDFDSAAGILTIRRSKGGQSRYVPLKPSAMAKLQDYQRVCQKRHPVLKTTAFFLTDTGHPLSYMQATRRFRALRKQLGWIQSPRPRMHDLRHTLYSHIQLLSRGFHDQKQTGDLISRLTSDIEASCQSIQNMIPSTPTTVSSELSSWPRPCWSVVPMLSMSLVTRLRMSPRSWWSK